MRLDQPRAPLHIGIQAEDVLTNSDLKRWLVGSDIYCREAIDQCRRIFASELVEMLAQHTFVLIKPDGIAARKIDAVLSVLAQYHFEVVFARRVLLSRLSIRELWRYEMNIASMQRLQMIDLLLTASDSVLLVLKSTKRHADETAAARLTAWKGPSLSAQRKPGHLRSLIQAGNGVFNCIHTPDEPIDVMRELGMLLGYAAREEVFTAMRNDCRDDVTALKEQMYRDVQPHALDLLESLQRLKTLLADLPHSANREHLEAFCVDALTGPLDWYSSFLTARAMDLPLPLWDWITISGHRTNFDVAGVPKFHRAMELLVDSYSSVESRMCNT